MVNLDIISSTGPDLTAHYLKKLRQIFIAGNSAAKVGKSQKETLLCLEDGQTA